MLSIIVENTNDSGPGSLRQAIEDANLHPGADTIVFNIPPTDANFVDVDAGLPGGDAAPDVYVVRPLSALPPLLDATIIDARTQTTFGGDTNPFGPEIVLDGNALWASGLEVRASGCGIYGLGIQDFGIYGLHIEGASEVVVASSFIGADATGSFAAQNFNGGIFVLDSANVTIGGVTEADRNLISANSMGIYVGGVYLGEGSSNNQILGNYIGTDRTGEFDLGNSGDGICVGMLPFSSWPVSSSNTLIRGNLISGNGWHGVRISGAGATDNVVVGNRIGTNASGTTPLGNRNGVHIDSGAANNWIGVNGVDGPVEGNLISGNWENGVTMRAFGDGGYGEPTGNVVAGNLVGVDATGAIAIPNISNGVFLEEARDNRIGTDGNNVNDAAERNVISGNLLSGVAIVGEISRAEHNVVAGNYIGVDAAGAVAIGNRDGVFLGTSNNRVGTNSDGTNDALEVNVIAGNGAGVVINGNGNVVAGNFIGTNATGATTIGNNSAGVLLVYGPNDNTIGGSASGAGNTIAFNAAGVAIDSYSYSSGDATGNQIRGNRIYSNYGLGIDLGWNNTTPNDAGDIDTGPNNFQNFPVLSSSSILGNTLRVTGSLNAAANSEFTIEFFASSAVDDSGYGEGEVFLGAATIRSGDDGNATFVREFTGDFTSHRFITATATDAAGNTSEFSQAMRISTIVVVNTNDSGPGSLRQAIEDANVHPGADTIVFNIPPTDANFVDVDASLPGGDAAPDVHVITPQTALPGLTDATIIDARTQTAFGGDTNPFGPEIVLDGNGLTADAITVNASDSGVYGLNIQRFGLRGLKIRGASDVIVAGNYIGTDATGSSAAGNAAIGVDVGNAANVTIGGGSVADRNVISGNGASGIVLIDSMGSVLAGNRIGTNAAGTLAIGNDGTGIAIIRSRNNHIGTNGDGISDEAEGNLISGNSTGVSIAAALGDATGNVVAGNLIGVNADGTAAIANRGAGVHILRGVSDCLVGTNGDGVSDEAERNVISGHRTGIALSGTANVVAGNLVGTNVGGTAAIGNDFGITITNGASNNRIGTNGDGVSDDIERNVISATMRSSGVLIRDNGTSGNVLAGNFIGTDVTGTATIGNRLAGVAIVEGAANNRIGTNSDGVNDAAEGNVISGNGTHGVVIHTNSNNNLVAGNYIGTNAAGAAMLGNSGPGVRISGAQNNTIGGTAPGAGNVIAFNRDEGIGITGASSTLNAIRGNLIHHNGELGIDLGGNVTRNGVTLNDLADPDAGPNNLQNFPELTSSSLEGNTLTVMGTLNGAANSQYTIEFFANSAADASGYGEGEVFLGATTVMTGADGNASFVREFTGDFTNRRFLAATATDAVGNTSEFSLALRISTITVVNTNDAGPGSLRQAIEDANLHPGADTIIFNIPATDANFIDVDSGLPGGDAAPDVYVITPLSALPPLLDATIIDGRTQTAFGGDTNPFGPEIVLDGNGLAAAGLTIRAGNSGVYGLNIQRFGREGLRIESVSDVVVAGNYIGTDAAGTSARGNMSWGVAVSYAANVTIGGSSPDDRNVISGNWGGVSIGGTGATNNMLAGNRIGTNADGTAAIGNTFDGVSIGASAGATTYIGTNGDGINDAAEGNIISGNGQIGVNVHGVREATHTIVAGNLIGTNAGGTVAIPNRHGVIIRDSLNNRVGTNGDGMSDSLEGNLISGNSRFAVSIHSSGNVIAGNLIGTDAAGMAAIGNRFAGISIQDGAANNRIGTNGDGVSDAVERNVISGALQSSGVLILGSGTSGNIVAGNLIGTNATATATIGNSSAGVAIVEGATNNRIGTNSDGVNDGAESNVISGNNWGVIVSAETSNNIVAGNYVGTNAAGATTLGNSGPGIHIGGARNTTVGGTAVGAGNTIAFNRDRGVVITDAGLTGNAIRGNAIHHNDELGIDLGRNGVTLNDLGDADTGPNNLQNFPELTSSSIVGNTLTVIGTLNSTPNAQYTIEFFANSAADDSGYGEGEVFLGATTVMTGADGNASFIEEFTGEFTNHRFITATATDSAGNTSEFSRALQSVTDITNIVDNSDPVGFALSGSWAPGEGPGVGRNDNVNLAFGEPGQTDTATWTFNLSGPGRYRVAATWFTNTDFSHLFTDAAPFSVIDAAAGAVRGTTLVNQKVFPNDFSDAGSNWEHLGEFDITGSFLAVRLTSTSDNATYVVADAIRIERFGDLPATAEIQVTESGFDITDGGGRVNFGTVDFNEPVAKTFTISNSGRQPLVLSGPVSVTGSVFEVLAQPALTTLNPGQSTTFQVEMSGTLVGDQSATVSFANTDDNEDPFNFTVSGTVLSTNFVDDQEPGFFMSPLPAELGGWGQVGGTGRPGPDGNADWVFNINRPGIEELATWTFDVTPGVYRVSTTWAFQNPGYDDAAPFTIFDGDISGTVVGGRHIDQKNGLPNDTDYAPGFGFPFYYGSSGNVNTWEGIDVVHISGATLTVLLAPEDVNEYVLADSILIDRLGDLPAAAAEIVVTTNNRAADKVDYGTTEIHRSIEKTFTIRNTGTSDLIIGNITNANISGPNFAAFEIVSGPSSTTIAPGLTATFVVRLTAAYPGVKNATITLTTNDPDEPMVNLDLTAFVSQWHIIDDGDAGVYSEMNMSQEIHGSAYRGDHSFAASSNDVGPASATWTFTNVSPGIYYVALTWIPFDSPSFASNAQLIVQDGGVTEADVRFSQRNAPAHFPQDGANWQYIVFGVDVSSPTVTVTLTNDNSGGYILADGAMLIYIADSASMPPPPGNSESVAGSESSSQTATPSSGGTLRSEPSQASATDEALLNTAYWDNDMEEAATLLAADSAQESDDLSGDLVTAGPMSENNDEELAMVPSDWLD